MPSMDFDLYIKRGDSGRPILYRNRNHPLLPEDIDRLNAIQELSEQGLNHEGIRMVLELRERVAELERENERLSGRLEKARERIQYLSEGVEEPSYEIVLRRSTRRLG